MANRRRLGGGPGVPPPFNARRGAGPRRRRLGGGPTAASQFTAGLYASPPHDDPFAIYTIPVDPGPSSS